MKLTINTHRCLLSPSRSLVILLWYAAAGRLICVAVATAKPFYNTWLLRPGIKPQPTPHGDLGPDDEPDIARHKLQVAVSLLRRSLNQGYQCEPGGGYILYKHQVYQINPLATIRTDVNQFLQLYKRGQQSSGVEMVAAFEQACSRYAGSFLAENLYADWALRRREQLCQLYMSMCSELAAYYFRLGHFEETVRWANAILFENRCDEGAHRQLMLAYAAQGRRNDALRQFHYCEQLLLDELSAAPMMEMVQIYQGILVGQITSST